MSWQSFSRYSHATYRRSSSLDSALSCLAIARSMIHWLMPSTKNATRQVQIGLDSFEQLEGGVRLAAVQIVDEDDQPVGLPPGLASFCSASRLGFDRIASQELAQGVVEVARIMWAGSDVARFSCPHFSPVSWIVLMVVAWSPIFLVRSSSDDSADRMAISPCFFVSASASL